MNYGFSCVTGGRLKGLQRETGRGCHTNMCSQAQAASRECFGLIKLTRLVCSSSRDIVHKTLFLLRRKKAMELQLVLMGSR